MPVKPSQPMAWTNPAEAATFHAAMEQRARDNLAKRLKELRRYRGWSADELAHRSGVSIRTVSRLETAGIENPRETTLVKLAETLEQTREELAGPRMTPEAIDKAAQTQLDRLEATTANIAEAVALLLQAQAGGLDAEEEFERELESAALLARLRGENTAATARKPHRRGKARPAPPDSP